MTDVETAGGSTVLRTLQPLRLRAAVRPGRRAAGGQHVPWDGRGSRGILVAMVGRGARQWGSTAWSMPARCAQSADGEPRVAARRDDAGEATWFVVATSGVVRCGRMAVESTLPGLSPVALAIVFWYSLAKRFRRGRSSSRPRDGHRTCGRLARGRGRGGWEPWLLALASSRGSAASTCSNACQDVDFDRATACDRSRPASA